MIFSYRHFRLFFLISQLFLPFRQANGQLPLQFTIGAARQFEIKSVQGTTFCWKVFEQIDFPDGKETDQVSFLTEKCYPSVTLKWVKAGIFFLQVTAVNENGCSNSKIVRVDVVENHFPKANNDYAATNWLKSIKINVLNNDIDEDNDIKPNTLSILTKPEYGQISPAPDGTITYIPLQNQPGSIFFSYRICDACNQCDTAKVVIEVHDPPLFLSQGVTPNGDGLNDLFTIKGIEAYPNSALTIFSRDGLVVYSSDDYHNDWDGTRQTKARGKTRLEPGTYYYLFLPGGTQHFIKGFIYLSY